MRQIRRWNLNQSRKIYVSINAIHVKTAFVDRLIYSASNSAAESFVSRNENELKKFEKF